MGDYSRHVQQAKHNQKFAEHFDLNDTEFLDWVVTGYFYAALQWIDAYFAFADKKVEEGHGPRNMAVNDDSKLYHIARTYRFLYQYSRNARYDLFRFTPDKIRKDVIPKLREIRSYIEGMLPELLY